MKLTKLYKRRSDGRTQEWTVEIKDFCFRTISGIVNGGLVTSEWTICEGKNIGRSSETSPSEQAGREAQALWQKQYDKGYRENVEEVDDLPYFKPMLAKHWVDYKHRVKFPIYGQRKLDGMRNLCHKDIMQSRNGKTIVSAPHILKALQPLFADFPSLVFDGELYTDKLKSDFNKIISLAKKTKPTAEDLRESEKHLQYHIYDLPSCNEVFSIRSATLKKLLSKINHPSIVFVETILIKDEAQLDSLYEQWLDEGNEGQMIRIDAKYVSKRTDVLLKRKEHQDKELIILDIVEGIGNRSGMAGFAKFNLNGKNFKANVMGNAEYSKDLLQNRNKYIGQKATVRYTGLTPDLVPRFPRMKCLRDYE